jgi:hypothetical protein
MSRILFIVGFIYFHDPLKADAQSNDAFWRNQPPQGIGEYLDPHSKPVSTDKAEEPGPILSGTVTEHLVASDFSYINVKLADADPVWVVVYKASAKVGEVIEFEASQQMEHFHSKLLNRDFAKVIFVDKIEIKGGDKSSSKTTQIPASAPAAASTPASAPSQKPMASTAGGQPQHLADLIARRKEFAEKTVEVQGKVTKYNEGILGKNWLHLSGNTPEDKDADLVITTLQKVAVGSSIKAKGKITIDENIGSGYNFSILLNDAQITEVTTP